MCLQILSLSKKKAKEELDWKAGVGENTRGEVRGWMERIMVLLLHTTPGTNRFTPYTNPIYTIHQQWCTAHYTPTNQPDSPAILFR